MQVFFEGLLFLIYLKRDLKGTSILTVTGQNSRPSDNAVGMGGLGEGAGGVGPPPWKNQGGAQPPPGIQPQTHS